MMNPYGVQRVYDLGLEELAREHGRQTARLHEVGLGRRRQDAAAARLSLMLAEATEEQPRRRIRGLPVLGLARRLGLRLARLQPRRTAA